MIGFRSLRNDPAVATLTMIAIALLFLIGASIAITNVRRQCDAGSTVLLESLDERSDPSERGARSQLTSISVDGVADPVDGRLRIRANQTITIRGRASESSAPRRSLAVFAVLDGDRPFRASAAAPASDSFYVTVPTEGLSYGRHLICIEVVDAASRGFYEPFGPILFDIR